MRGQPEKFPAFIILLAWVIVAYGLSADYPLVRISALIVGGIFLAWGILKIQKLLNEK